jgi:hypothetical protein
LGVLLGISNSKSNYELELRANLQGQGLTVSSTHFGDETLAQKTKILQSYLGTELLEREGMEELIKSLNYLMFGQKMPLVEEEENIEDRPLLFVYAFDLADKAEVFNDIINEELMGRGNAEDWKLSREEGVVFITKNMQDLKI